MQSISADKSAQSTIDWRFCGCGTLARAWYFGQKCPGCGKPNREATAAEIEARGPAATLTDAVAIHGRRQ